MNRIKAVREQLQITQTELANRAEISQPFLHDLEYNKRGARPETMQRIAESLGVTVDELEESDGSACDS